MTSGTPAGITKQIRHYTEPTTCHHRKKTWLGMKLPERKAKQKNGKRWSREGLEERKRERVQKHNLTPASSHAREPQMHTLTFPFVSPKANLGIFCFCYSSHAIKSPVEFLGQGCTLFLTNHFMMFSFHDGLNSLGFICLFSLLLKTNTNKDNLTPLSLF